VEAATQAIPKTLYSATRPEYYVSS
jgi:hypothetical protein